MNYVTQKNMKDILDGIEGKVPMGQFVSTQTASDSPLGTIIAYMGITPPDGFLACDGSTYNIADYTALATHIMNEFGSYNYFGGNGTTTFAVPDLRGEFLRGTGTNSHASQGNGGNVGSHQDSTTVPTMYTTGNGPDGFGMWTTGTGTKMLVTNKDGGTSTAYYAYIGLDGKGAQAESTGLCNVRPTNTSVLYCIKYTAGVSTQYSTTEQVIGTWIDGSTLYQCTFSGTTPTSTSGQQLFKNVSSYGIVKCITIEGNIQRVDGTSFPLNTAISTDRIMSVYMQNANTDIYMNFVGNSVSDLLSQQAYVTLTYTKV